MKRFSQLLVDVQSIQGWIVKCATGGPIIQILVGLGPPWPTEQMVVAIVSAVVQVFVVMWALTFWEGKPRRQANIVFAITTMLFALTAVVYAWLFASTTEYVEKDGRYVVIGNEYRPKVEKAITEIYGGSVPDAIHELRVEKMYERKGLIRNRIVLVIVWTVGYLLMSAGMTSFAVGRGDANGDKSNIDGNVRGSDD